MFTRIENLGPLTRLGDLGRVLAFAHCPGWRWMLWVTTTRILVLDSLQRCLWWSEAHPGAHANAAAAIGQDGRWGVLYRTKEEDWTSAAMNSRVLTGMAGSHTPPVDPADLWMHSCFLPTSAGVGCDIGSAILRAVRFEQHPEDRGKDLIIRNPRGGVSLVRPKGRMDRHPNFPLHLVWTGDTPQILSLGDPHRKFPSHRIRVQEKFLGIPFQGHLEWGSNNFSWTRLGGFITWFHGWIGQWGNHTSTGKGSRNLYSFNKRGNSYAPMESLQGELWYLQEDFLVFERSFAVIPAQGIPVFEF